MRKKILMVLPSLVGGGAERVMVTLLQHLDRNKYDLNLALISKSGPLLNEIPDDVNIFDLGAVRVRKSFFPLLKLIWRIRPETILCTMGYLNLFLILTRIFFPKRTRLVVREANTVSENLKEFSHQKLWKWLYRIFYKRADLIICQSKYMMKDLFDNFNIPLNKMTQIYNPVDMDTIQRKSDNGINPFIRESESINLVAIGRLTYQKGFDRLIESMPEISKTTKEVKLWIIGVGPLEEELKKQRDLLGLREKVIFVGFQDNPYVWLKHADLFILSSYYEGLPNVLLEAMCCYCPVLVVDHPGGTYEIMDLTKQNNRITDTMSWNSEWLSKPGEEIIEITKNQFGVKTIIEQYSQYL